jgi:hypothetical protein
LLLFHILRTFRLTHRAPSCPPLTTQTLPPRALVEAVAVAARYGAQDADVNVSLSAVSLMWSAADALGAALDGGDGAAAGAAAVGVELDAAAALGAELAAAPPAESAAFARLRLPRARAEEALAAALAALQALAADPRPEVRNSGVRTLLAVVAAHGPRLSPPAWEAALWGGALPSLRHAFAMCATSSGEEAAAAELGRSKGRTVRLVVHHSRNTAQKQWDETVAVALAGVGRLLRARAREVAATAGAPAGWEELMTVSESCMAGGRKEVALAAISLVGGVLAAHGGNAAAVPDAALRRALRAVGVGVEAATSAGCAVPAAARVEVAAMVGAAFAAAGPRLSDAEAEACFGWAAALARNPWSDDDASAVVPSLGMPPVQRAALALLPGLAPRHAPHLWPAYLRAMLRLVQPEHVEAQWRERAAADAAAAAAGAAAAAAGGGGAPATPAKPARGGASAGLTATPGPPGAAAGAPALPSPRRAQHRHALNSPFLDQVPGCRDSAYYYSPPLHCAACQQLKAHRAASPMRPMQLLGVLVAAFEAAPAPARAATLAQLLAALGRCMEVSRGAGAGAKGSKNDRARARTADLRCVKATR